VCGGEGLFQPNINFEIWNATEFLFVIRDQNAGYRKDMRGVSISSEPMGVPCLSKKAEEGFVFHEKPAGISLIPAIPSCSCIGA